MRVTVPSPLLATQTASSPTATAPGSGPTAIGSPTRLAALDVDPGDRVRRRRWRPRRCLVPASMPPGRSPTSIGSPSSVRGRGVDPGDGVGAAVGDPDQAAGDGDPGRAAADGDRRVRGRGVPRSMRRTLPVEALLTQRPPAPTASRSGAVVRRDAALEDPPALGVDRGDAGAVFVGDPDPAAAEGDRAGAAADVDPSAATRPLSGSMRRTSPRRGSVTQTEPSPTATPGDARAEPDRLAEPLAGCRGRAGSGCRRVALVTQTASVAGGDPQRRAADRDRRRRPSTPSPPSSSRARRATATIAATIAPGRRAARRSDARPRRARQRRGLTPAPAALRRPRRVGRLVGRSESTWVAAGVAPSRSRAAAISAAGARVAVGRVLGDGALDHRVEPLRHLRLGVGFLARVGDDPGQRLVEDAAERVDVGGRADRAAAPLLRRHVLGGADHRGAAAARRSSPSALARPKSER